MASPARHYRSQSVSTSEQISTRGMSRSAGPSQEYGVPRTSIHIPKRFEVEDEDEDTEEDGAGNVEDTPALVQQSVYGMIFAGATKTNVNPQTNQIDSGSEDESNEWQKEQRNKSLSPKSNAEENVVHANRTLRQSKSMLRSLLRPAQERSGSRAQDHDAMTQSQVLPRKATETAQLDRPLSAQLQRDVLNLDRRPQAWTKNQRGQTADPAHAPKDKDMLPRTNLVATLKDVFHFDELEDIVSEFPCWYLQNVLLSGHMYITKRHVCFYAYLPKRSNATVKSGHLAKQGKRDPRYSRHWFVLKGDIKRFEVEDEDEDTEEDGAGNVEDTPALVQQSVYGMIFAGATKTNVNPQTNQIDSGSEDESNEWQKEQRNKSLSPKSNAEENVVHANRTLRQSKSMLRSLLRPAQERSGSRAQDHDAMTQSQVLPRKATETAQLDRPLSAQLQRDVLNLDRRPQAWTKNQRGQTADPAHAPKDKDMLPRTNLVATLKDVFHFDELEDIVSEFPCWYLQNVLLSGHMYITKRHVCFYAYLPKRSNATVKSGHLAKQGKRDPRYSRHWFVLKGDILSYYASAAEPYFPIGTIDLRYGVSADLLPDKGRDGEPNSAFTIITEHRTYYMKADSPSSAKEWVKHVQKIIFRSRNDSDSVKISLPISDIMDVESNPVIDLADTIKLRVIENDETYAVDDYFFTFFGHGKTAYEALTKVATMPSRADRFRNADTPHSAKDQGSTSREQPVSHEPQKPVRVTSPRSRTQLSANESNSPKNDEDRASSQLSSDVQDKDRRTPRHLQLSKSSTQWNRSVSQKTSDDSLQQAGTVEQHDDQYDPMSASQIISDGRMNQSPILKIAHDGQRPVYHAPLRKEADTDPNQGPTGVFEQSPDSAKKLNAQKPRVEQSGQRQVSSTIGRPTMSVLAAPIQRAFTLAEHVRTGSKRMSSYLGSSPKDYYTKFSGAFAGGKRHYSDAEGRSPENYMDDADEDFDAAEHERRFQEHFALPLSEKLVAVFYCWLHRVLPLYGKVYISQSMFCFRSLIYGTKTKLVIPFRNIDTLEKEKGFRFRYPGMCVVIRGHEEVFFDFASRDLRDDCVVTVLRALEHQDIVDGNVVLTGNEIAQAEEAATENKLLQHARGDEYFGHSDDVSRGTRYIEAETSSIDFDDPTASLLDFTPKNPLRITCLTIGSRGDVQPYVALGKGLLAEGHSVSIATHARFKDFIEQHGIEFKPVAGDPEDLMQICVDYGLFTPGFLYEGSKRFRPWLQELLESAWVACQGSELLIESPSTMAGVHIAEALEIPYFRAFTMPWTRTRAFPHAFMDPTKRMGGQFNYMTYGLIDNIFWRFTSGEINDWRLKSLGLKPTSLERMQLNKIPFLYNFSPHVVIPPLDYSDWVRITGYWFLNNSDGEYTPTTDLAAFIKRAREDGMKLVYIGFGSVTVKDSKQLTQQIIDAVIKADVRCVLSKGWSDHFDQKDGSDPIAKLPSCIYQIRAAPHDWLFPQMDAVVHHGGAGTTGAGLRAGIPTIIKPFFGDQFFFAMRVQDLGVGLYVKKVSVNALGRAIWIASHDDRMRTRARRLGEQIRGEDGVATAIKAIYRDLEYAKTLVGTRGQRLGDPEPEEDETAEESWTFVENDGEDALLAQGGNAD
nr:sterol 3-beta-glucosyltransferase [Quercus suber]